MANGGFNLNPYSSKSYRTSSFNTSPFSLTPLDIKPYTPTPYNPTPYTLNPYNQKTLYTAFERINYLRDMRLRLPNKNARAYLNRHNAYQAYLESLKNKKEEKESYLVNYDDPKQINSIRDIVLGSFNPNMDHSTIFGDFISKIPILNMVPDTLAYVYNYSIKPQLKGDFLSPVLNLLINVSETLDVVANPIKATAISIADGENVGEALLASTFGTSEGIKNYDYDTGNIATDLILELISDPLNYISFGGSTAVKGVAKGAGKKAISESAQAITKSSKKITKQLTKAGIKEVTTEGVEQTIKQSIKRSQKTVIKGLLRNNISDELLLASDQKFLKVFTKNINKAFGDDVAKNISESVMRGLRSTAIDINTSVLKNTTASVIGSLGMRAIAFEDKITRSLLKYSLYPSGVYGLYKVGTSTPVKVFLEAQILKRVSDVVSNRYLSGGESFLKAGAKNGYIQVAQKEMELNLMFPELAKAQDPQQAIAAIGVALGKDLESIKNILKDTTIPNTSKREMINGILQKLDTYHAINSIDDYLIKLEDLSKVTKHFEDTTLNKSGLEQYITEFYGVRKALDTIDNIEVSKKTLEGMAKNIESAKAIKQFDALKVFDNYSIKDVLKAVDNQVVAEITEGLTNIPTRYLDNLIIQYQKAIAGGLTSAEIDMLKQSINKIFSAPYKALANTSGIIKNADLNYLTKNLDQILNNMVSPKRGALRPAIVNNMQNVSNRIKSMLASESELLTLNKISPGLYESTMLKHTNVLGTDFTEFNTDLLTQLKKYEDTVFDADNLFKDSELYKWADEIDTRYNDLADYIDKNTKYIDIVTKEVNTGAYSDGMVRIQELQKASEEVADSISKLNYTDVDIYDYTSKILKEGSLLSKTEIHKIYESLDVLKSFGETFGRVYDYNIDLFDNTKQHLDYYMRLINAIDEQKNTNTFKVLYHKLRKQHDLIMTDFRQLESIIGTKNVWDLKNAGLDSEDLSGLGKNIQRHSKKIKGNEYWDGSKITVYNEDGTIDKQFVYQDPSNITKINNIEELSEAYDTIKQTENLLCEVDFGAIDLQQLKIQYDSDIYLAQLDNIFVTNALNNNEAFDRLRQNGDLMNLIEHIVDADNPKLKFAYDKFTEDDMYAFRLMYLKMHSVDHFNKLQNSITAWYDAMPKSLKPKYVNAKNALITTLANYRDLKIDKINLNTFMEDFIRRAQGYVVGSDPLMTSYKLDALKAKYNILDSDILNDLEQIKDITPEEIVEAQRHSALFDTIAQIKVVEAYTGKPYYGMMLDIETSGGLGTNANITEITLLRRNPDTNQIEKIFSNKIQVPEDVVKSQYMLDPDTLYKMYGKDLTEADYIKKFTSATQNYGEEQLLSDFYNTLAKQKTRMDLMTHNGDDFDILFLQQKIKKYHIDDRLTPFSMARKVKNLVFKNEQLNTVPFFEEVLSRFNIRDSLKELAKDRFVFSKNLTSQIYSMLKEYLDNQSTLETVASQLGRKVKFIDSIDSEFFREVRGMVKIDDIRNPRLGSEWLDKRESILNTLADSPLGDGNLDEDLELLEIIKNKKLDADIFKDSLDPSVKNMLYDFYTTGTELIKDVGFTNTAFRSAPITSSLFENPERLMKIQNAIADILPEGSVVAKILREKPMENLSQLLYAGVDYDPTIAYKKFEGSLLKLIDTDNVPIQTSDLNKIYGYAKQIKKVGESIYNLRDLISEKNNIYAMLTDLKKTNIIFESSISKLDSENLQFTYATLEVLWRKIKFRALYGQETKLAANKIVEEMSKKYSKLVNILDNDIVHYKMITNTDVLKIENTASEFNFPEFLKMQSAIEQSGEAKSLLNRSLSILDKVRITRNTASYKVKAMDTVWTMSNELILLDEIYNNSFVNGLPTALTQSYIDSGRLANEVLTAWETNKFLQMTPEQILYKVINSGRGHSITLRKPSNKYFNNTQVFDQFTLQKSELTKLGITWDWNEETQRLTLGINDDLASRIKFNKNPYTRNHHYENGELILGVRYKLDGVDVPEIVLPEIDEDIFKKYVIGNKEYVNQLWTVRQGLIEMNPELSGRWGLINYIDTYNSARNNPIIPKFAKNKLEQTEDYLTYFNDWNLGEFDSRAEFVAGLNTDYRQQLNLLGHKMLEHSHNYLEYGQFIMQGGIKLDSDVITKMSTKELINMLNENKDFVIVYLADNKNAVGGYTLRKLNTYTAKTLEEAKRIGATIVPWDQYEIAAKAINQFTYSNKFIRSWYQVIQLYKKGWLASLGTIIRNGMDSTLKNFAEGDSPSGTIKSYTEAFDLLHRFDSASRAIKKLDPWGRFRLANAEEYFKLPNAKLDKDTYQFLYDFMQNNGTNAVSTEIDGIFGVLMKPNSWIERTARLTQYLNLADQGLDYSNIMRKISQTHFNYDLKSYSAFVAQRYIPFYTYVSNNINYVAHLIEENPSFMRNFFNSYTAIWDLDSYDYEELAGNSSLQYQIINGNIPLKLFGYEDKEITRIVNTKYGPREQKVTNTAVLKTSSSILDGLMFFNNPIHNIKEKLAPPFQLMIDSYFQYQPSAFGNIVGATYTSYEDNEKYYQGAFGSNSIQNIFKDPKNLIPMLPGIGPVIQRATHTKYNLDGSSNLELGTNTYGRTENKLLEAAALLGITGATSRWGEFTQAPNNRTYRRATKSSYTPRTYSRNKRYYGKRVYHKKLYPGTPRVNQGMTYRFSPYGSGYAYYTGYTRRTYPSGKQPYSKYKAFIAQIQKPNYTHRATSSNISGNMQSIPQYLYSYMGKNKQGKSKPLSWIRMNTEYKVKNTLRRYASL